MSSYVLDTNHLSAVFKADPRMLSRIEARTDTEFGVAMPSVGEMWFMVFNSKRIQENTNQLERILRDFRIWDYDLACAREFGKIKAELRAVGRAIPDVDTQIAAVARLNALTLLTSDKHFAAVSGLTAEDWLTP